MMPFFFVNTQHFPLYKDKRKRTFPCGIELTPVMTWENRGGDLNAVFFSMLKRVGGPYISFFFQKMAHIAFSRTEEEEEESNKNRRGRNRNTRFFKRRGHHHDFSFSRLTMGPQVLSGNQVFSEEKKGKRRRQNMGNVSRAAIANFGKTDLLRPVLALLPCLFLLSTY